MSERHTPQSHSRVKSTASKNTFLPSEKSDGGKVSTNAAATDSQAVVNYNRQQRYSQNNNTNYSPSYNKGDKSEQQYYIQPKPAYKFNKSSSNLGQPKAGKYSYSAVSSKPQQQIPAPGNRVSTPRKPSPIPSSSVSPEPTNLPPPPVNTDTKAPVLQGAWANPPKVRSESSNRSEQRKSPSPGLSLSPISTDPESLNTSDISPKNWSGTSKEYFDSAKNNGKSETSGNSVNWPNKRRDIRKMPAPTTSGPRSGASSGIGGNQADRMVSGQDRNSPTGTSNSSSSHATRSGSNSINGPTSGVGSPSGSSVSVNGLERCPIGSTVKCVMLSPTGTSHNGSNGPASGVTPNQPASTRQRNVFEGEVLAFDPRTKVLVLKCPSTNGKSSVHDVHIINLSLPHEIKILADKKETVSPPSSLNITRLENRLREQVERKKKQVMAFKAGVSPVGQKLFQAICKTIDDVSWHGENIYVLKEITIYPPYKPENVKGNMDSKALKHVRKIVEKHISDQSLAASPLPGQNSGASSPYSTPTSTQTARGSISAGVSPVNAAAARATSPTTPTTTQQSSAHGGPSASSREPSKSSGSSATSTLPNQPSNKNNSREGSKRGNSSANSPNTHGTPGSSTSERSHGGGGGPQSARNINSSQHHSHYQNMKSSSYNQ